MNDQSKIDPAATSPTAVANDDAGATLQYETVTALTLDCGNDPTEAPLSDASETASMPDGNGRPVRPAEPTPGTVSGYEIIDVLGRGAMGVVYRARQPGLKRVVALKMILSGDFAAAHERARFRAEAELIARLQHPNIVQVFEIGEDAGLPFFSMEYVEGISLAKKIAATPQPPRDAAQLLQTLATAMHSAHVKNIIHRDLKPANILVAEDGTPKITDFGLAKTLEDPSGQTHSGTILGSPSYMSPEQAEGRIEDTGRHSDIYSLGAVLYELLTGRAPFKAGSVLDTLQQVKSMEPVAPVAFAPSVPRDLETICLKCLQKDPVRRYSSAAALAEDLRRFLAGEPILARPVSAPERLWRWARRNPRVASLSGAVVLAVLAWGTTTSALALSIQRQKERADVARLDAIENAEKAQLNAAEARDNAARADRNASAAEANRQQAEKNAAAALANEKTARENAERAQRNALIARRNHELIIARMLNLGERFQKRLGTRRVGTGLEMQVVRDDLLRILRETVLGLGKEMEVAGVTSFAGASSHQHLGDLLVRIGMANEALGHYEKAIAMIWQVIGAEPNNDKAKANLAIMLWRLGAVTLELSGDAKAAVKNQEEAVELLREVAAHPKGKDYSEADTTRLLSFALMNLGKTHLARGDVAAADRCFGECLKLRQAWMKLETVTASMDSYLSEAQLWLGVTAARAGRPDQAEDFFRKSEEGCEALIARFPNYIDYKADLAEICLLRGNALALGGRVADAAKLHQKALENVKLLLSEDTGETRHQELAAAVYERLGAVARDRNRVEEATEHFGEALKLREGQLQLEPGNRSLKAARALILARTDKRAEASALAGQIRGDRPDSVPPLVQVARTLGICARGERDDEAKKHYTEESLAALQRAVADGWKDVRMLETDPDLATVRTLPAYRDLVTKLK